MARRTSRKTRIFILIIGASLVCSNQVVKPVYLGDMWLKDFYLYPGRGSWLEGRDICWSQGGIMHFSLWKKDNWYIWTKANKENWSPDDHLWMGLIKAANSELWYEDRYQCKEKSHTLPGERYDRQQCAVLNMSMTYYGDPYMVYATSCNDTFTFACLFNKGTIPEGVDVYSNSEMVEVGDYTDEISNVFNETECAAVAFNRTYDCYASTFDHVTGSCRVECASFPNIPENITIMESSTNKTLLLHRGRQVFVNAFTPNGSNSFKIYPCINNYSTSEETSAMPVTTTYDFPPTLPSDNAGCSCICASAPNITEEKLNGILLELKNKLKINVTSLSATVRQKTSAPDARTSSAAMGALGLGIITSLLLALIVSDAGHFVPFLRKILPAKLFTKQN